MTGKVKCTCGWSWNKSDSSKKDMYICHECGRDNSNNMKDGGWLDNYNDYNVSAPEGMEGDGFSNVGRNSSPAWGGQFQMGGNLPGAVGNMYARTGSPSKGPRRNQTDVTDASAQNGKEMQYYQNGLDWKPKTISKNGAWLDNYDEAQNGKNVKFDAKKFAADKKRNTPLQKSIDKEAQSEDNRRWTDSKEYKDKVKANKLAEDKATIQDRKDRIKNSVAAQKKSFTKDNWRQQLADETQATGDKFRLFPEDPDSFIDEWMNPGVMIGNMASDLGSAPLRAQQEDSYMPYATSIGVPLLTGGLEGLGAKTTKQFVSNLVNPFNIVPGYKSVEKSIGKALGTEEGLLSNAYKLNPYAERLNDANKSYRVAGMDALEDFQNTGVLRSKLPELPKNATLLERAAARPTAFPSFQKGYADMSYASPKGSVVFETALPTFKRGEINPVTNLPIKGRHYAHRVINPDTGGTLSEIPSADIKAFGDKPHWLQGYKEVPKQEDGGIIKDDRGQWNHPGEITEIGSNDITMEGVPYDVLGVSDTGDVKLMKPGKNYKFKGKKVTEYPMAQDGIKQELSTVAKDNTSVYNKERKKDKLIVPGTPVVPVTHGNWLNKLITENITPYGYLLGNPSTMIPNKQADDIAWETKQKFKNLDTKYGYERKVERSNEMYQPHNIKENFENINNPISYKKESKKIIQERNKKLLAITKNVSDNKLSGKLKGSPRPERLNASQDALNLNQGVPQKYNSFVYSNYKPSNSKEDSQYYSLAPQYEDEIRQDLFERRNADFINSKDKFRQVKGSHIADASLKDYQYSKGKDEKGDYIAYYDVNDYGNILDILPNSNPFEIYGRIYYDKKTGKPIPKQKNGGEFSIAQNGLRQEQKGLQNIDNLTNFTNYNKPTIGGWLNKYKS